MASYKKYAEDLIGNWETGQYEPIRTSAQNIYQTNINKLANDFGALKDKLARNFANAQLDYQNTMNAVQNESFNRMRNANIDLANRGLSTSGMGDLVTQGDVQQKGQDVDKALADLLAVNNASIEGLTEGTMNLGERQSDLAGDLGKDLGGITDKEAANAQQYANLIAGIGENAAQRAASRARSGGGGGSRSTKSKKESEADEVKRRILIADTLASKDLTDDQKKQYLNTYLGVPGDTAVAAVDSYNMNNQLQANRNTITNLQNKIDNYNANNAKWLSVANNPSTPSIIRGAMNLFNVPNAQSYYTQNRLNRIQNENAGLTYTDLAELLYGRK